MAVFPRDADTTHLADFVRGRGLGAFRNESAVAKAKRNLPHVGYAVAHLDAPDWDDEPAVHQGLAVGLRFTSHTAGTSMRSPTAFDPTRA